VTRKHEASHWLEIIRAEYREMPCLALTLAQAQRLWNLDAATCESVLEQLRCSGFLRRTQDGRYSRTQTSI
jgi:DNA-binding IclR family transcriptional regulator